jgi:D-aminoacyl-tRNA deacylase
MECTHHGPTDLDTPSLFVELGSGETQWADDEAAGAVARATLDLRGVDPTPERTLVGFGGGHYVPRFERVVRETDWAVGHVAADWGLDDLPEDPEAYRATVRRAAERSGPGTTRALVEGDRPFLRETLADLGVDVVSETWARETTGVPPALVDRLEGEVAGVEEGLRFGALARRESAVDADGSGAVEGSHGAVTADADLRVVSLPDDLLAEVNGIDGDRALAAVRERAVAVRTEEGGTRLAGSVVVPAGGESVGEGRAGSGDASADPAAALVEELVAVLAGKYDDVERRDGHVVATERAFDPELARTLGVSEGPAFGRLSAGEAVEVGGETVPPEAVHRERERRFALGIEPASDVRQTSAKDS